MTLRGTSPRGPKIPWARPAPRFARKTLVTPELREIAFGPEGAEAPEPTPAQSPSPSSGQASRRACGAPLDEAVGCATLQSIREPGSLGIVNFSERRKKLLRFSAFRPNKGLPNTHVPVVVCRSAGIWTRGQLTVRGRPAAGGEPANPAQRGTRLEATTDRAFLVSVGPPKPAIKEACLSCRACGREFSVQTMALAA